MRELLFVFCDTQSMHSHLWEESWAPSIRGLPLNPKKEKKQGMLTSILTAPQCKKFTTPMQNRCQWPGLSTQPRSSWTCPGTPRLQLACPQRPLSKLQGTSRPPQWERTTLSSPGPTAAPRHRPSMIPRKAGSRARAPRMNWYTRCRRAHRRCQKQGGRASVMFSKKSFEGDAAFYKASF